MARKNKQSVSLRKVIEEMMKDSLQGAESPPNHQRITDAQYVFAQAMFEKMLSLLSDGNSIRITNFGTFSVRLARQEARNPRTSEVIKISHRKRIYYKASESTISLLNTEGNQV